MNIIQEFFLTSPHLWITEWEKERAENPYFFLAQEWQEGCAAAKTRLTQGIGNTIFTSSFDQFMINAANFAQRKELGSISDKILSGLTNA